MPGAYVSTDCRTGHHLDCQARRIIPGCPCRCHHHAAPRLAVYRCDLDEPCPGCRDALEGVLDASNDLRGFVLVETGPAGRAEVLVVSGEVTPDRRWVLVDTYSAVPTGCPVVAIGDCSLGILPGDPQTRMPAARDYLPVDAEVAGCPPRPEHIEEAIGAFLPR